MKQSLRILLTFAAGTLGLSASQIFSAPTGSPFATAEFVFSNGSATITLTNLTTTTNAANLLTDLVFKLSAGPVSYAGVSGQLVDVGNTGAITVDNQTSAAWGFGIFTSAGSPLNGEYLLCTVCGAGVSSPNGPSQGILGPGSGAGSTPYSTANGSIKSNDPHNPFFNQTATFTVVGTSLTADTLASDVFFSFGTTFGTEIPGSNRGGQNGSDTVPEPMSFLFVGSGLVSAAVLAKRRRSS